MSQPEPNQVFISYSHKDKKWLERLQVHLKPLEREERFSRWDDTRIKPGSKWRDEIEAALKSAKVAILLVSADFLASDFIAQNELPPLLAAAEKQGAVIIPVIVSPSQFEHTPTLSQFQAVNSPSQPLSGMTRNARERVLAEVANAVKAAFAPPEKAVAAVKLPHFPERNPLFTGREDILAQIEQALRTSGRAALSGLGGAGKTQTAIEYAYRHASEYADMFWINAASREALTSAYAALASTLNLPESAAKDQIQAVEAAKRHLASRDNCLVILDNADDVEMVRSLIPGRGGHVLLTTRARALGTTAKCIEIKEMNADEATELLLRRAKIEDPSEPEAQAAREIATNLLDRLPLALDQAAAYIEETGCGLRDYIELYKKHAPQLLNRRGMLPSGHPDPVATTWALSFENIEKANPAAADLLRLCAFLAPDVIPQELLATQIADELALNDAIAEILKYSLVRRDRRLKAIEIHRPVQEALKDRMASGKQRSYAERAVCAVRGIFPDPHEFRDSRCYERILSSEHPLVSKCPTTCYLVLNRNEYAKAEPLYQRALAIWEKALGPNHPRCGNLPRKLRHLARRPEPTRQSRRTPRPRRRDPRQVFVNRFSRFLPYFLDNPSV